MQALVTESFDRYARYSYIWEVRQALGRDSLRILDVGDPAGYLGRLFPADHTVSLDLYADPITPMAGHQQVIASGFDLPFPDGSFDLAASHDTFEHLPDDRRTHFVDELLHVSRGPALLVAPFADPRTRRCEQIVNSYYVARIGHSLDPLDEHADNGLPDFDRLTSWLDGTGVPYEAHGDGWLYHWLGFMLLNGHLVGEGDLDTARRVDTAFNRLLRDVDATPPHYRRAVVLRPPRPFPQLPPVQAGGDVAADLDALVQLGLEIEEALPRGADPLAPGSALRAWADAQAAGDGPVATLAGSMGQVLAAAHQAGVVEPAERPAEPHSPARPRIGVVIVNLNGAEHLPTCLDSLAALDYPSELVEVVVVDNASTDGSRELLAADYPWVRVLPQERNLGFAPAVNLGARALDTECIALLNNDIRVEPDWLRALAEAYNPGDGYVCVAGVIHSWDGTTLDFGEGTVNFYGHGNQMLHGRPVDSVDLRDGQEILFACGGSMLVGRQLFVDTGGFDDSFFAYYEDVDFGWRLWVLGFKVRLATGARCYHHLHGTASRFAFHQRLLLYERNALRTMIKNYDDHHLQMTLGPALLLMAKRAQLRGALDRTAYDIGADGGEEELASRMGIAHLHAMGDIVDDIDQLFAARRLVQRARRRSDEEIFELFERPFQATTGESEYVRAQASMEAAFGLDAEWPQRATRVLVVSSDEIGEKMRGPAVRAYELARAVAGTTTVTVAVPRPPERALEDVEVAVYHDDASLRTLADMSDVVLIQGYTLQRFPSLAAADTVLVVDLYDPWLFENLELHPDTLDGDRALRGDVSVLNALLDAGDFFICASERQRDYWLGMLTARGRVNAAAYGADPSLRSLIDVVPFGLPDRPPRHLQRVLKGVHPQVAADDLVVLWGGGTWDWFDPVTLIEAFEIVVGLIPNAKLYFLGLQLPGPDVANMEMADRTVRRAEELGLAGTSVVFGDWSPYDLRESYLLEADVAVSAARDLAETRLAFRSRILDYLWAGVPVVSTAGDVLSDLVEARQLGFVVPPGDKWRLADALVRLLGDPALRAECSARARASAAEFTWTKAAEPLRQVARNPGRWRTAGRRGTRSRVPTEDMRWLVGHQLELERHAQGLEWLVQDQQRRLDRLQRLPVYPLFRWAKRVRQSLRRGRAGDTPGG